MVNSMMTIRLARLAAGLVRMKAMICNNQDIKLLSFLIDEILADCSQNCQSTNIIFLPNCPAIRYNAPMHILFIGKEALWDMFTSSVH